MILTFSGVKASECVSQGITPDGTWVFILFMCYTGLLGYYWLWCSSWPRLGYWEFLTLAPELLTCDHYFLFYWFQRGSERNRVRNINERETLMPITGDQAQNLGKAPTQNLTVTSWFMDDTQPLCHAAQAHYLLSHLFGTWCSRLSCCFSHPSQPSQRQGSL